jgi:hypothetical protein
MAQYDRHSPLPHSIKSRALPASGIDALKATLNLLAPTDPVDIPHTVAEASSVARIIGILGDTNRPLTLGEVKQEFGKVSADLATRATSTTPAMLCPQ